MHPEEPPSSGAKVGVFATTHWSVVLATADQDLPQARVALEQLCRIYWYPLYFYVRRLGHSHEDAQDLTQEFFARLLEKNYLAAADPEKGKFRTLLLVMLKRFLANKWEQANRQKRGGGAEIIPLDPEHTQYRYLAEPPDDLSPDKAYDRRWARILLARVTERLRARCMAEGKGRLFAELQPLLSGQGEESYEAMARRLQVPKVTFKVLVHRFRQRYGQLLREEIASTVSSPEQVQDELHTLLDALS